MLPPPRIPKPAAPAVSSSIPKSDNYTTTYEQAMARSPAQKAQNANNARGAFTQPAAPSFGRGAGGITDAGSGGFGSIAFGTDAGKKPASQGGQQGTPRQTTAPSGVDQTMPGYAEQYWNQQQDRYTQPGPGMDWVNGQLPQFGNEGFGEQYGKNNINSFGAPGQGEQFWNQVAGSFNTQGQYSDPNLAKESYNRTVSNIPGSLQPQFDQYYDRAKNNAMSDANSQAASRGAYGSSSALNNVGNISNDFESNRAKANSEFALQDSHNQMGWQGLAGAQGRAADQSSLQGFGANLQGLGQFGDMAFQAGNQGLQRDQFGNNVATGIQSLGQGRIGQGVDTAMGMNGADLSRLNSGMQGAQGGQNAFENRANTGFNNQMSYLQTMLPWLIGNDDSIIGSDQTNQDAGYDAALGIRSEDQAQDQRNQARHAEGFGQLSDIFTSMYGMGGQKGK